MKVIESGNKPRHRCTGYGNGNSGCGALLEVERSDLRYHVADDMGGVSTEYVLFKCCECGSLTDLPAGKWPQNYNHLRKYSTAWKWGREDDDAS
jgi:hypothetical protein